MLTNKDISEITKKIAENVNPEKIYLFGSYAYGKPTEDSDLDIAVIDDRAENKDEDIAYRINKLLYPRNYSLEIVAITKKSLEEKKDFTFWKNIIHNGKVLYERI